MVRIDITQGQGITQAIKAKIGADNVTNNSLSVWQDVMTEVKTANDSQPDNNKYYSGGDDVSKIGDRSHWHTDFKVHPGNVIELAQGVWDRIVQLLTGHAPEHNEDNNPNAVAEPAPAPANTEGESPQPETPTPQESPQAAPEVPVTPPVSSAQDQAPAPAPAPAVEQPAVVPAGTDIRTQPEVVVAQTEQQVPVTTNDDGIEPNLLGLSHNEGGETLFAERDTDPVVTGPAEGESPEYDAIVRGERPTQQSTPTGPLNDAQLQEYLSGDEIYQGYLSEFQDLEVQMSAFERQYNITRLSREQQQHLSVQERFNRFRGVPFEEKSRYTDLQMDYNKMNANLQSYKNEMKNWVDGPLENGTYEVLYQNGAMSIPQCIVLNQLERVTLPDGRRAWRSDKGTFLPGPDGKPDVSSGIGD